MWHFVLNSGVVVIIRLTLSCAQVYTFSMYKKWKTLSNKKLLSNPYFEVFVEKCETAKGKILDAYYRMEVSDWVQVIAVDVNGDMVLIDQYRHGSKKSHLEIVAGAIESGEEPLQGAKRELLEETGYSSDEWSLLATTRPNPALQANLNYTYLARNAKKVAKQSLDPFEEIEVKIYSVDEVKTKIEAGDFDHSLVLMSLLKYFSQR